MGFAFGTSLDGSAKGEAAVAARSHDFSAVAWLWDGGCPAPVSLLPFSDDLRICFFILHHSRR